MPVTAAAAPRPGTGTPPRRSRVDAGLAELDRWLADQVRTGLAGLPKLGYAHLDAIAARMVDAQAPGVAGILRGVPGELGYADWPDRVLHTFAGLHLLSRAHRRIDELPDDLAATVRSRIGYSTAKADVLATPGVSDTWWAVGAVDTNDQQLRRRRVWLRGSETGITGVWMTFAPPGMSFDESVLPGTAVRAVLHRYPGVGQPRVLLAGTGAPEPAPLRWAGESIAATRARFAQLVADDPWATRLAVAIEGTPVRADDGGWWLRDAAGDGCPLVDPGGSELAGHPWPLLAQSGGEQLTVFGEWGIAGLAPLSVLPDDTGRSFSTGICG